MKEIAQALRDEHTAERRVFELYGLHVTTDVVISLGSPKNNEKSIGDYLAELEGTGENDLGPSLTIES